MTSTADKIKVMQAFEDGAEVQTRNYGEGDTYYFTSSSPLWSWHKQDYRIKPAEPRTIWVNEHKDGVFYAYPLKENASNSLACHYHSRTAVEYREVIKDED